MPLHSMTGYGRAVAEGRMAKVTVELTSVNRRQLDMQVVLPRPLAGLEPLIRRCVQAHLARGSVTVNVTVEAKGRGERRASVDESLAAAFVRRLRLVARQMGLRDDLTAASLASFPGVLEGGGGFMEPLQVWPTVRRGLNGALRALQRMRAAEGRALARDLGRRLQRLRCLTAQLRRRAPHVLRRFRYRLEQRLTEENLLKRGAASEALAREIVLFAERSNVDEELARLESHLDQFQRGLRRREPVGRRLDFLCQELQREIHTVGAKANDAGMVSLVLRFKMELECLREQVQNVE